MSPQAAFCPARKTLPGIGDRIVRPQSLPGSIQQVHTPGVGVATLLRGQEIAIRRRRIDPGQHGRGALEDLVMQAHPNAGQVLLLVDDAGLPRGLTWSTSWTQPTLIGKAQQVAQELHDAAIRAVADQRQPDDHLAQPGLGHRQLEQRISLSGTAGEKAPSSHMRCGPCVSAGRRTCG